MKSEVVVQPHPYRQAGWWTGERLIDRFESFVAARPDATAVVSGEEELSRSGLWEMAGGWADELADAIEGNRRPVVVHLPNEASWLVVFLAILRAGHVPATTPITTTTEHLQHIIELTGPAAVVSCRSHRGRSPLADATEAADRASATPVVLTADTSVGLCVSTNGATPAVGPAVDAGTDHIMFTSSTTGPPKAVSHSNDSLATLNRQFADRFGLDEMTPLFMPSPLGHSVGAIHGARLALYLGSTLILQDVWDPAVALELVADHGASFTAAATPFLFDLLNADWHRDEPKLASLRSFLCGGAQVPPSLIRRSRVEFPNTFVTPLWGMTEGGLTTCTPESTPEQIETTVGFGLPDLELGVIGDDGVCRTEGHGELVMRGPGVFNGYCGQRDLYDELIIEGGFFRTGDLAQIDAGGYVSITGRLKDLIIRGGVNISPVYTENALSAHPDVHGVAVIGWPDDRLGERLCAVVQCVADLELAELQAHCGTHGLSRRHWPERLETVDEFPRTAAGKIRKHQLRDDLLSRETPDTEPVREEELR